ncbi:hypothetical protein AB205_0066220, partial [Aquarana catesbeiana]
GDFGVQVEAPTTDLTPGHPLEVICSVTNTSPGGGQFRVVWLLGGTKMAVWEPSGVVTFRKESGSAGEEGRLVMHRRDLTTWVLRISQVRIEDGGSYVCEVTDERSKKSQTSKPMSVEVKRPGLSQAQHEVTIEQGPIYRTVGSHITIWCKVSGNEGASNQEFEFSVRLPSDPEKEIKVVSTSGPGFSYAIYSGRVQSRDIYVEKVSRDHTILHIVKLQEKDTGEYECYTPNTASTYLGTYSAKTNLTELRAPQVSLTAVTSQLYEGDSVGFRCLVSPSSSSSASLGWFRKVASGDLTQIASILRDGRLVIGADYKSRHDEGHLVAEKGDSGLFILRLDDVTQSDKGEYVCRYSEGTQDEGGAWIDVNTDSNGAHIDVQRLSSYSPICTSPSSFYLLLTFTILFIILALALIALALWRRRGSAGQRRTLDGLWSSVKMSEMEKENEGQTCRTDDEMTPATLPTTFSGEGNLYSS